MSSNRIIYITPRFWPEKEDRNLPFDEGIDWDNPNVVMVLTFRNKYRLYYRNWVAVWRTYEYYSKWALGIVPLALLYGKNLWMGAFALALLRARYLLRQSVHKASGHGRYSTNPYLIQTKSYNK
jgi:hypothetical protein